MCLVGEINQPDGKTLEMVILPNCAYVLPDQTHADVTVTLAWCTECDRFVPAESIPSMKSLAETIAKASTQPITPPFDFICNGEAGRERLINDTMKQKEWRAKRFGPPRCLECGSLSIKLVPADRTVFPHPANGSDISVSVYFGSTSIDTVLYLYDVEGNRIGETVYIP